jgi:hypothetical protein
MKIGIASHVVFDIMQDIEGKITESLGGPVCYGSIIAKTFNFDTLLFTKAGYDIDEKLEIINRDNIHIRNDQIDKDNPTTRIKLNCNKDGSKNLILLAKCSPIDNVLQNFDNVDGFVLSPVIDEIPFEIFQNFIKVKKSNIFTMLNPRGFIRQWNKDNLSISYKNQIDFDFNGITAFKIDEKELSVIIKEITVVDGIKSLKKKFYLEFVILTGNNYVLLLHKNILYSLTFKEKYNFGELGLGDILTTGFSCSYLKEKDPLWAFCFGVGSIVTASDSKKKGLEKVPRKKNLIERNASYFYNTVKFKVID